MRTRFWKLTALVLALMLALTGCSLIEIDEEMDNSETVALVNGEKITKGEVADTYAYYQNYYSTMYSYYYGNSDISNIRDDIKDEVLEAYIERTLIAQKAAELGLDQLSDEDTAAIRAEAESQLEEYIEDYSSSVNTEGMDEDAAREAVLAYLEQNGLTLDVLIENGTESFISDRVHDSIVADVTVDDAEIESAYNDEVSSDESSFASSTYLYEMYRANGSTVYWNPEGYRTVKHILLKMSDEQSDEYAALTNQLSEVEASIADLESQTKADAVQEAVDATAEPDVTAEPDATEEPQTLEELTARKAELETAIEAKKEEIIASFSEKTDAIYADLESGKSFDDVMAEYGEDPGMQSEPGMTSGYYVAEQSTYWESVFTEAALALEKIGDVSQPVLGKNGVHIIYYNSDVTPGAVALDDVREELSASVLETKQQEVYSAQYQKWYDAANVKKYPKKMD